jgi:DNA-binding PadR family transcriptional regulator
MKTGPATEYALLGALRSGAKHGYEILQYFEDNLGSTWYVSTSQLYALLKRLENRGWLRSSVEVQEARPSKRVFSLTPKGKQAFEEWLFCPTQHVRDLRVEFLAKLFFLKQLHLQGGTALVEAQVRLLESLREQLERMGEETEEEFQKLVLDARRANIDSWKIWLSEEAGKFVSSD